MNIRGLLFALLAGLCLVAETEAATPRLPPSQADVEVLPFCGTEKSKRLDPKQPGMFRELEVTVAGSIHIHGRKQRDNWRLDDRVVYHLGKAALISPEEWKGKLTAKEGTKSDVRAFYAVLDLGDELVSKDIPLDSFKSYSWNVQNVGGEISLTVMDGTKTLAQIKAPSGKVKHIGFAATVRWKKNEADLEVSFDS